MDDLISRAAALHATTSYNGVVDKSVAKRILIQLPPAQPEVVRCKDCRWRKDQSGSTAWLPCRALVTPEDFYCGRAERRTD